MCDKEKGEVTTNTFCLFFSTLSFGDLAHEEKNDISQLSMMESPKGSERVGRQGEPHSVSCQLLFCLTGTSQKTDLVHSRMSPAGKIISDCISSISSENVFSLIIMFSMRMFFFFYEDNQN